MNKLTLEDNFLSLEQAKELQELGIDFEGANAWFYRKIKDEKGNSIHYSEWRFGFSKRMMILGVEKFEYVPTLSVAEMLEMLPEIIKVKDVLYELYLKKSSFYIVGYREYLNESLSINEFIYTLIRDALFEMLKWLKQNKLTIEEMEFYKLVI